MPTLIPSLSLNSYAAQTLAVLVDSFAKGFILLALAWVAARVLRRASAATRHWLWFLAVASLLALPGFSLLLPRWQVMPRWLETLAGPGVGSGLNDPSITLTAPASGSITLASETAAGLPPPGTSAATEALARTSKSSAPFAEPLRQLGWKTWTLVAWLACTGLALVPVLAGMLSLWRLGRRAVELEDPEWLELLAELKADLKLKRPVRLLLSGQRQMPMAWGHLRPRLLLPAEALEWAPDRRRVVLLHELAHLKRHDCLTQLLTRVVCALYWPNPLAWLAQRAMTAEREQACDDAVLGSGAAAPVYAEELLGLATGVVAPGFAGRAAIAMARPSTLEQRLRAILDASRNRRAPTRWGVLVAALLLLGLATPLAMLHAAKWPDPPKADQPLQLPARLKAFFAEKAQQAEELAKADGKPLSPKISAYFATAARNDWAALTNAYAPLSRGSPQYNGHDQGLAAMSFQTIIETYAAFGAFASGEPKYASAFAQDIIASIPPGSVYFGGTDSGRGLITAFSRSHARGDPFYTLTQNALLDTNYVRYARFLYGKELHLLTEQEAQTAFAEYLSDAQQRLKEGKLKPGEQLSTVDGKATVNGQVAVMQINARLARLIFDRNPDKEFYLQQSFPLDWMYPYLSPHGLILKLNREPMETLSEEAVRRDQEYWSRYLAPLIGPWLKPETPLAEVAAFVERVFVKHDLEGFTGDPEFVGSDYACNAFSKLRSDIAGIYAWRLQQVKSDRARMLPAADLAFRQAYALCPYAPEALYRYINLCLQTGRIDDALLLARTTEKVGRSNGAATRNVIRELEKMQRGIAPRKTSTQAVPPTPTVRADAPATEPRLQFRLAASDPQQPADLLPDPADPAGQTTLRLLKEVLLDEVSLESASVLENETGNPSVRVRLTRAGSGRFGSVTTTNVDRRLAIVLDGKVLTAPVIRTPITGGMVEITGSMNATEVAELARVLNQAAAAARAKAMPPSASRF